MYKTILTHAPRYLSGSIIASTASLLMLKYYTFIFSTAEYGILAMYLLMFKYVTSLVSLNMDSGATPFYFEYKDKRDELLSTIFWFIVLQAFLVFVASLIVMPFISEWIAPDSDFIYIMTVLAGIGAVFVSFLTRVLYNEQRSLSVFKHSVFQTFVNHFSSFILISFFSLGIFGRISGQGLGYFINVATLIKEFSKESLFKLKITFNKLMWKRTFLYSFPGVITLLQSIVFVYLDRIFLKYFYGDATVGIYSLGFMLGQSLSLVYSAVAQAILPKVYTELNQNYEVTKNELEAFSYKYYIGLIILTMIISSLSTPIVSFFSNENYLEAASVVPFIMSGFMMGGFYKIPSLLLEFHKKAWFYPFFSLFAFGTNAVLNYMLIPVYGMVGAAFASFVGLFLYSLLLQIACFKYMRKTYNFRILIIYLIVFIMILSLFMLEGMHV